MPNTLVINFINPSIPPSGGYEVKYRPKGSIEPYFTLLSATGTPITITDHILANVDYEGTIRSICAASVSTTRVFSTKSYNNAIGDIIVDTCPGTASDPGITAVTFNAVALLPFDYPLPVSRGTGASFISNETGLKTLVITHTLTGAGSITITDSASVIQCRNISAGSPTTFTGVTINSTVKFIIHVVCTPC